METYALVYDEATGEIIRIELESPEVNIQMNDKGEAVITNIYTVDKSGTCVEGSVNPRGRIGLNLERSCIYNLYVCETNYDWAKFLLKSE